VYIYRSSIIKENKIKVLLEFNFSLFQNDLKDNSYYVFSLWINKTTLD